MTDLQLIEKQVNEAILVIGIKLSALRSTLSDEQLENYNNYIIDYIESNIESLKASLSPERLQELKDVALK